MPIPPKTAAPREEMTEVEIDETLAESFPASDPPSWTLGTDRRAAKDMTIKDKLTQTENNLSEQTRPEGD